MVPSQKRSSKTRFVTWLILFGVCGDIALFLFLAGFIHVPGAALAYTGASTPIPLDSLQFAASTLTPFQPLPTDTPTFTPVPTFTSTPDPTETPLPTNTPFPTNTPLLQPTSDGLPASAAIAGIYGYDQTHRLSCESRSAVDWARYFGVSITEDDFQSALPTSDDPDSGFVGSPDGLEGNLPPNAYGVHADPVAALLQQYGLNAQARHGMSYEELKNEIANGHPVIVWVFGNTWWGGTSVQYTAANGHTSTVIAYEHTVIVMAYDDTEVTILDGGSFYYRTITQFESSWATLGNMAVIMK